VEEVIRDRSDECGTFRAWVGDSGAGSGGDGNRGRDEGDAVQQR